MSNFRITPNALSHKLKLHQLQIFERVLARRSLSRAASEMHLTQPTVTKAIHDLEAFFGATLFERSNRGVTPTELALVLGRRVHAMMAEIRYMADDIDAVLGGASGHVVVGTLIAASAKLLPEAIARLMTEHPGIQVTVREGPSAQLLPALATGDVDIVVGRLPGADMASISGVAVDHHKLYREDLCLVAGASHPLAGAARVSLAELADHIWILPPHLAAARLDRAQLLRRRRAPAHASRRIAVAADQYRHPDAQRRAGADALRRRGPIPGHGRPDAPAHRRLRRVRRRRLFDPRRPALDAGLPAAGRLPEAGRGAARRQSDPA